MKATAKEIIHKSNYWLILQKLEKCLDMFSKISDVDVDISNNTYKNDNNMSFSILKEDQQTYNDMKTTVMRYTYRYFNLLLVPSPSVYGRDMTTIYINDISKNDLQLVLEHF